MSVDVNSLKAVIKVASDNYRCWPWKTFIVNTTFTVNLLWKVVSPFLHAQTKAKIELTKNPNTEEMIQWINPTQLEKKFGG